MKSIAEIVEALGSIPRALVQPDKYPFRPPVLPSSVTPSSESPALVLDLPEEWDYPDWVDHERWLTLDRDVSGTRAAEPRPVGTDALAWYVSFHQSFGGAWGIFIPVSSLSYFETRAFNKLRTKRIRKWQLAYDALLAHEQMHFAVDYVCAQWELLLQSPSWASFYNRKHARDTPYLPAEEQLANAYMLRRAASWKSNPSERALRSFVASQPTGYRDGPLAVSQDMFDNVVAEVTKSYIGLHALERDLGVSTGAYDYSALLPSRSELAQCPVQVIRDEGSVGLPNSAVRLILRMCNIREGDRFQRRLQRLDRSLQKRWAAMKQQLLATVPRSARLEKMRGASGDLFSVRLNDNFRVHLRMEAHEVWQAVDIGSHKEMGHG